MFILLGSSLATVSNLYDFTVYWIVSHGHSDHHYVRKLSQKAGGSTAAGKRIRETTSIIKRSLYIPSEINLAILVKNYVLKYKLKV